MNLALALSITLAQLILINCESAQVGKINIEWKNRGIQTDFFVTSPAVSGLDFSNAWLGIGFNSRMVIF